MSDQTLRNWVKAEARVERLTGENAIWARYKRRFKATTDSLHSVPLAPNLLERNFTPAEPDRTWTQT